MHAHDLSTWTHKHRFETGEELQAERKTWAVVALTLGMMVVEIGFGLVTNSMALLSDGFHMSTHATALGIAAFAYWYARRHADNGAYTFGTGKVGTLAAFASAIILSAVSLLMIWESGSRLLSVQSIAYDEALWIAVLGLGVNVVSAIILGAGHEHGHDHHQHDHHHHHDQNLQAAYTHVIADAFTSVLAIVALISGKYLGWWWLDPLMGIVGAAVIMKWAYNLIRQSSAVLLDRATDDELEKEVRAAIEGGGDDRLADLHLWQVGPGHWAAILSVVTHLPRQPNYYRGLLASVHELSHVTVEVHSCH